LRDTRVLLTFDDGYRDNYDLAFPILRSHGVQGVFFLPTTFIGTDAIAWWDEIANLIQRVTTVLFERPIRTQVPAMLSPSSAAFDIAQLRFPALQGRSTGRLLASRPVFICREKP